MVVATGVPDFGPEFNESMRRMLKAMEPILKQHQATMAAFSAQLAASGFLEQQQETLRKFNETIAPTLASIDLPTFAPETLAAWAHLQQSITRSVGGWSKLPVESGQTLNFSFVEELGAAAVEDPELAAIVQETEQSTPELSDEIREFSIAASLRENLTPEIISAGIYVLIQLSWLAVALLVAGYAPLAAPLLEILGFKSDLAGKASKAYLASQKKRDDEQHGESGG